MILILSGTINQAGDPRKDTPLKMFKSFCPTLTLCSFTAVITIFDIILYIITLCLNGGLDPQLDQVLFLPPNTKTLSQFGNRDPYEIRYHAQLWRLITPVFLHANFLQIFFNAMGQLIVGSIAESMLGTVKVIVIYFLCAIGGNMFGALVSVSLAVGASTAIVGLLGAIMASGIVNWKRLFAPIRCTLIFGSLLVVGLNFYISVYGAAQVPNNGLYPDTQVDMIGYIGGLITGIFSGMFMMKPIGAAPKAFERKVKIVGIVLTFVYFIIEFSLFFTIAEPSPHEN